MMTDVLLFIKEMISLSFNYLKLWILWISRQQLDTLLIIRYDVTKLHLLLYFFDPKDVSNL